MSDERPTRRTFLKTVSTGVGLAGIGACGRPPAERILPYQDAPPELVPGTPLHYATSLVRDGWATGVIVRCREGRPVKIEGNPDHPTSLGATTAFDQASILDLYDPQRVGQLQEHGIPRDWSALAAKVASSPDGTRLRFLLGPSTSPTRAELVRRIVAALPGTRFTFHDTADPSNAAGDASRRIFGRAASVQHDFSAVDRVLVLDADPFGNGPMQLAYGRQYADRRRIVEIDSTIARLWVLGPRPTCTSALADRDLSCRGSDVAALALALLHALAPVDGALARLEGLSPPQLTPAQSRFVAEAAVDLASHRGAALVVAGDRQPWPVHATAIAINTLLGAIGRHVWWTEPVRIDADEAEQGLAELVTEMRDGRVDTLVVADVDGVYATAADIGFADALSRVRSSIAWARWADSTARACAWIVPAAHDLESWLDARAYDGTISFAQPLVEPLYGGRTLDELLALWTRTPVPSASELVRGTWARRWGDGWQARFDDALQRGLVPDTRAPVLAVTMDESAIAAAIAAVGRVPSDGIEVGIHLDARVHDGRYAANAWLQELPDPVTKQTWGNAVLVPPTLAQQHGWERGDIVAITIDDVRAEGPIIVVRGHADDAVSIQLGYGQPQLRYADFAAPGPQEPLEGPIGFSAQPLVRSADGWYRTGATLLATGRKGEIAITQDFMDQRERPLAVTATLAELRTRGPGLTAHLRGSLPQLGLVEQEASSPQWGMVIDLSVCTGCSACVIACQAENNLATVGHREVQRGREMHWLRIDRYHTGAGEGAGSVHQPMLCQHCEYAPCEYVCPVNATVHSPDGLNEMVYNRCVGTRFCSNNCPYHVRRFNWFDYGVHDERALQKNPEVTVRERGVMEKCTYCVQRIRRAGIRAELEDRSLRDGDVETACQQACPTSAIVFGDIADPQSRVSAARLRPQRYAALHELGTRPRTLYLAQLRDPGDEGST